MRSFLLLLIILGLQVTVAFKICAFNIKSFGEAKASNKKIMSVLVKILARCDISAIQEVRDSKGEAVPALVSELNRFDGVHRYQHLESKRLGKNSYKEQFVFIYRADTVQVMDWYQYVEDHPDHPEAFAREPFAVRFLSPTTVIKDFVLMSHHTCPSRAASEINRLLHVMLQVKSRWKIESLMLLGDLNAACGYVTAEEWRNIQLQSGDTFHWLIGDKDDTTVKQKTHCAYDRIVVHGEELLKGIIPGSAKPFNFKRKLGLSEEESSDRFLVPLGLLAVLWLTKLRIDKGLFCLHNGMEDLRSQIPSTHKFLIDLALEVSDHFPVEVNLRADPRMDREL